MAGKYVVRFVGAEDLTCGKDWLLLEIRGDYHALFREDRLTPTVLMEAWGAYRYLTHQPSAPTVECRRSKLAVAV